MYESTANITTIQPGFNENLPLSEHTLILQIHSIKQYRINSDECDLLKMQMQGQREFNGQQLVQITDTLRSSQWHDIMWSGRKVLKCEMELTASISPIFTVEN